MNKKILIIYLFLFLSLLVQVEANEYLYGEFIYNYNLDLKSNPFPGNSTEEFENKISENFERGVIEDLLEEARWIFSGMIYGFEVEYTPSDISRSVERYYRIDLFAQIVRGDIKLEVYDTFLENNLLYVFIRYKMDDYQVRRIEYWNSGVFDSAAAYGRAPFFSENSRINSIKDAIRISLENYLKSFEYNKPRLITGEVLLRESPSISISAGDYRAFVKSRLNIKNVQHYLGNN